MGRFSYTFENLNESLIFYVEANGVESREYQIKVIKTPSVTDFEMSLNYPKYTQKRNEHIKNTGNAIVPEGTRITWNINTEQTDSIHFITKSEDSFIKNESGLFSLSKKIRKNTNYQIATSNQDLKNYEKLNYSIQVIKDEFPKITVKSDIDSVSRGPVQFAGQLSDDYSVSKLNLVYYDINDKENLKKHAITINKSSFEEFYYLFIPNGELEMESGKDYELYFEVFDNDAINGNKSSKSKLFFFHKKTKQELSDDLLKEQKESLDNLDKNAKDAEKLNKDFEEFTDKLKKEIRIRME